MVTIIAMMARAKYSMVLRRKAPDAQALALLLARRLLGVVAALVFRILSGHRQVFAFSLGHELDLSVSSSTPPSNEPNTG